MRKFHSIVLSAIMLLGLGVLPAAAKEFRWADSRGLGSLEPHFTETFRIGLLGNIYEGLTAINAAGKVGPSLATSWQNVEPTRWRFTLRQGVKFHNGETFTADDAVFSIKRAMSKNSNMRDGSLGSTQDVVKVDDYTVDLVTARPEPELPRWLRNLFMMSKSWAEQHNAVEVEDKTGQTIKHTGATRDANGTGPFKLVEWVPNVSLELTVNPDWWGGRRTDALTSAKFFQVSDPATRLSGLLSGQLDMIVNMTPAYAERIRSSPGIKLETGKNLQTNFIMFDLSRDQLNGSNIQGKNPFKDRRVREALYLAIDTSAIISKVMKGFAYPSNLPVNGFSNGFDPAYNTRAPPDPQRARQLLAEAGYPNGFSTSFECPSGGYMNDQAICLAVSAMLAQIGIQTSLNQLPYPQFIVQVQGPTYGCTLCLYGWSSSSFDAGTWVNGVMHSRDSANGLGTFNLAGYNDPVFDQLSAQIATEMDHDKRMAEFGQVWQKMTSEYLILPLLQQSTIWAMRDGISIPISPLNTVSLKDVKMDR